MNAEDYCRSTQPEKWQECSRLYVKNGSNQARAIENLTKNCPSECQWQFENSSFRHHLKRNSTIAAMAIDSFVPPSD